MLKSQLHTLEQLHLETAPLVEAPRRYAMCVVLLCAALRCLASHSKLVGVSWISVTHLMGMLFPNFTAHIPARSCWPHYTGNALPTVPFSHCCSATGMMKSTDSPLLSFAKVLPALLAHSEACRILLQTLPSVSSSPKAWWGQEASVNSRIDYEVYILYRRKKAGQNKVGNKRRH